MRYRPMSREEAARHHFIPQAVLGQPPSFFVSKGVVFRHGSDDLDDYDVAELSLEGDVPFALLRYRGTPPNETTLFLPDSLTVPRRSDAIAHIVSAFDLASTSIVWQRALADTPF